MLFKTTFRDKSCSLSPSRAKQTSPRSTKNDFAAAFQYYRHRFRYKRHFGQVTWLMQAFSKWWQVTGETDFATWSSKSPTGCWDINRTRPAAFINDHQPDAPGYTTAVYLEGIAAALAVAASLADNERYQTYSDSFARGFAFLDRLIIQERDQANTSQPGFRPRRPAAGTSLQRNPHRLRPAFTLCHSRVLATDGSVN